MTTLAELEINVPRWIEQDIDADTVRDIAAHGCDSGVYMPAVAYWQALATMAEHGDEVTNYLEGHELAQIGDRSWSAYCSYVLATAVEMWAAGTLDAIDEAEKELSDACDA